MSIQNYYKASLTEIIRYLCAVTTGNLPGRRYFIEQGLGLERRQKEYGAFWQPYLSFADKQQEAFLRGEKFDALTVLGAGRLYDLNLERLSRHFRNIELVDADGLCVPAWKRAVKRLAANEINYLFTVKEITGLFPAWTAAIKTIIKSHKLCARTKDAEFEKLIKSLEEHFTPFAESVKAGETTHLGHLLHDPEYRQSSRVVFSQNILSQIGTFWFSILLRELERATSHDFLTKNESRLEKLNILTNRILYTKHFADLNATAADRIFITTDLEISHYWPDANDSATSDVFEEPITTLFAKHLPNYKTESSDSTLWHVKPAQSEGKDYEIIHRVGFFSLRKIA